MKIALIALKAALMAVIGYFLFSNVDVSAAGRWIWSSTGLMALTTVVGLCFIQAAIGATRLQVAIRIFDEKCRFSDGFVIWMIGAYLGQAVVSFVGGDLGRVWRLVRIGVPTRKSAGVILFDRIGGFIALIVMSTLSLPALLSLIDDPAMYWGTVGFIAVCLSGIGVFFLAGAIIHILPTHWRKHRLVDIMIELISVGRHAWVSPRLAVSALGLSALLHGTNILAVFVVARLYGLDISLLWCVAIVPPIMLLSMMPVSFSGWGVREGVLIAVFGYLGYAAETSLAVSLTFGLGVLIASLPGAVLFVMERKSA